MPRSEAFEAVVTRVSTDKFVAPEPAVTTSQAMDAVCRLITGDQTVVAEPAE